MRYYSSDTNAKLDYLIKASLYAQYAALEKKYKNVEDFLKDPYRNSIFKDWKFKYNVSQQFKFVRLDTYLRSVRNLIRFYQKKVKENENLDLDTILCTYKDLTRTKVEDYVRVNIYKKQQSIQSEPTEQEQQQSALVQYEPTEQEQQQSALVATDFSTHNNCFGISPIKANHSGHNSELSLSPINIDNIDEFNFEFTPTSNLEFDFSGALLDSPLQSSATKSLTQPSPSTHQSAETSGNSQSLFSESSLSVEAQTAKPSKQKSSKSKRTSKKRKNVIIKINSSKKKKSRKLKVVDPTLKRITSITEKEKTSLELQKKVAELTQSYSKEEILSALELQDKINLLCNQLKFAIECNYLLKQQQSKRDGFDVSYSNNMGYHCQNGKLKGFTINENNKYYHQFDEEKREKKTVWEQQIWNIGIEIMKLKGFNEGKGDTVCMEFGFMKKGNYVEKV